MSSRRGLTLTELMVATALSSSLMMTAIMLVHQAMRIASVTENRMESHAQLDQLARQYRLDVHKAVTSDVPDKSRLILSFNDGREIAYEASAGVVTRIQRRQSSEAEEKTLSRRFTLDSRQEAQFIAISQPPQVTLQIRTPMAAQALRGSNPNSDDEESSRPDSGRLERRVTALVGRSIELLQPQEPSR